MLRCDLEDVEAVGLGDLAKQQPCKEHISDMLPLFIAVRWHLRIGLAIARRLGQEGANLVVSSRREKNVEDAVTQLQNEGMNVTGTVCNVSRENDRKSLIEHAQSAYGGIDVLVSNAAISLHYGNFLDVRMCRVSGVVCIACCWACC
ncbi:hypothetical protein PTSG_01449 [Salpingoeca rosetta]|uniref:Uncharacterized protein n=1 Tax=Salpingoeca rosetta (strain ATCC 50818 / BSB-021) TaxID=946362 RepID=F2U0D5_SALR5|nr:uncharacterized protein PTSG_01449 [Salpingoeca rosetta]EGD80863.1 hypothetical protein PTSG_01449 [Salpingoeca rosetta]|eukprot:XP_004997424.1 hypothetical protein PTSG_01449 [Salpingoeca rosetta]